MLLQNSDPPVKLYKLGFPHGDNSHCSYLGWQRRSGRYVTMFRVRKLLPCSGQKYFNGKGSMLLQNSDPPPKIRITLYHYPEGSNDPNSPLSSLKALRQGDLFSTCSWSVVPVFHRTFQTIMYLSVRFLSWGSATDVYSRTVSSKPITTRHNHYYYYINLVPDISEVIGRGKLK
jgi:hypothetical protein